MAHESDRDTNSSWGTQCSHRRIESGTERLGNKWTSGDHPNESVIKIGLNTEKSPGDLRRPAVTRKIRRTILEEDKGGTSMDQRT